MMGYQLFFNMLNEYGKLMRDFWGAFKFFIKFSLVY